MMKPNASTPYEIQVDGVLGERWDTWFHGDLDITHKGGAVTTILARVPDQAALRGLVNRLWDLNLTIIYLQKVQYEIGVSKMEDDNEI